MRNVNTSKNEVSIYQDEIGILKRLLATANETIKEQEDLIDKLTCEIQDCWSEIARLTGMEVDEENDDVYYYPYPTQRDDS